MGNVALLSEIHPLATSIHDPFCQANDWYKVFTEKDIEYISSTEFQFSEAIRFIFEKLTAHDKLPVIRDWTHFDYFGIPFVDKPGLKLLSAERLGEHFNLLQFATVRHPIDQYISIKTRKMFSRDDRMNIPAFLSGYLAFAKEARAMGYIRYEDFTRDPDGILRNMCAHLKIDFDAGYKDKWYSNSFMTGDVDTYGIHSRGLAFKEIKPLPRMEVPIDLPALFDQHDEFYTALDLLGYKE
jgi:hypothetical protein